MSKSIVLIAFSLLFLGCEELKIERDSNSRPFTGQDSLELLQVDAGLASSITFQEFNVGMDEQMFVVLSLDQKQLELLLDSDLFKLEGKHINLVDQKNFDAIEMPVNSANEWRYIDLKPVEFYYFDLGDGHYAKILICKSTTSSVNKCFAYWGGF